MNNQLSWLDIIEPQEEYKMIKSNGHIHRQWMYNYKKLTQNEMLRSIKSKIKKAYMERIRK